MKHRIGESGADISVLLERLAGTESARRAEAIGHTALAIGIGLALPAYLIPLLRAERPHGWGWWMVVTLVAAAPFLAFELVLQSLAVHVISPDSVSRVSPFRLGSWRIDRADIHAIDLEISPHGPIIHIVSVSGRTRSFLLRPGFHRRLSVLYPEVGNPDARVELSPGLGRFMYTLLAVVTVAFIVVVVVLAHKQLITWE